jgi:sulfate/thiosulfate transport system substrate-binding protein
MSQTFNDIGSAARWGRVRNVGALALTAGVLAACQGAGPSDVVGGGGLANAHTSITLVAYSVPEPGWSKVIPAFNASQEGKAVQVVTSYAASADQSRGVVEGKPADVVNFSVEPDITRLVKAGKVSADWDTDGDKGIPFGSVVTLVVRKGNPKNIRDWDDLLRPGVEVITPSPLSSGSAKWNLLAPYAVKSGGGRDSRAGVDFISKLVHEHVKLRPGSGRIATDVFVEGSGDVLISYENEAIAAERKGKPVEHVSPPQTFKIENPVAVVSTSQHLDAANAFKNFQYTAAAQKVWAQAGFRPVDPAVATDFRDQFPVPVKLWTIADLGGWSTVDPQLFDKSTGSITKIYLQATG